MKSHPLLVPPNLEGAEIADCDDFALQMKATLTALRRTENLAQGSDRSPPAIAIVVADQHALTAFITANGADLALALADASDPTRPISDAPDDATRLFKYEPAIQLIYF
jgi:hypothetical protein